VINQCIVAAPAGAELFSNYSYDIAPDATLQLEKAYRWDSCATLILGAACDAARLR
jgi:hypothetical protein